MGARGELASEIMSPLSNDDSCGLNCLYLVRILVNKHAMLNLRSMLVCCDEFCGLHVNIFTVKYFTDEKQKAKSKAKC